MLDHIGFNVRDLERSVAFYEVCLAPLGLRIAERHGDLAVIISGKEEFPFIWMGTPPPSWWTESHRAGRAPIHLAFTAQTKQQVDEFHAAALKLGGTDNGAPGDRGRGWYAAYVIDPDGNNIEAGVRESS